MMKGLEYPDNKLLKYVYSISSVDMIFLQLVGWTRHNSC